MNRRAITVAYPLILVSYILLAASFFHLRFGGYWSEGDTSRLLRFAQSVNDESTIMAGGPIYSQGYGFPVVLSFLKEVSGSTLKDVNPKLVYVTALSTALTSFALYRSLTLNPQVALLSSLLLLTQPEFIFSIMRGSHEKITWLLACSAVLLLVKGFGFIRQLGVFSSLVFLFYLCASSLIATNVFFASSFIFTVAIAFAMGNLILQFVTGQMRDVALLRIMRLQFVTLTSFVLLYFFIFYLYEPAYILLRFFNNVAEQYSALVLDVDIAVSPYSYVAETWLSAKLYIGLTLLNWLILGLSAVSWLWQGWAIVFPRKGVEVEAHMLLLWLLYAGFAFQMVLSVLADFTGVFGANLQVRLFPAVMLFAIPLVVSSVYQKVGSFCSSHTPVLIIRGGLVTLAVWAAVTSILKATNEPVLSNRWTFYSKGEEQAVEWVGEITKHGVLWTDFDNRLEGAFNHRYGFGYGGTNILDVESMESAARYALISNVNRSRRSRFKIPLPVNEKVEDRIYDNGSAEVYHLRPRTPYQF